MKDAVKIICENDGSEIHVQKGSTLGDIEDILHLKNPRRFIAAYVNNKLKELYYEVYKPKSVRFIDITHFEGMRIYQRTLFFILVKAVKDIFPEGAVHIEHSVARGYYGTIKGIDPLNGEMVARIKSRMLEVVRQDVPIVKDSVPVEEAIHIFEQAKFHDKVGLLKSRPHKYISIYWLAEVPGYFYGKLAPSTGYVELFDLELYDTGFYLAVPKRSNPQELEEMIPHEKMFEVFSLHRQWMNIIDVHNIGSLNQMVLSGHSGDLIKMGEAFQEKFFSYVAEKIMERHENGNLKLILISGPSSSGKTSSCKRLSIQLRVLGLRPIQISMDDYFLNRDQTPLDAKGRPDYESLGAVDVKLLNDHLLTLFDGGTIEVPRFDFHEGMRSFKGNTMTFDDRSIILIEGIHGLNPALTPLVDDSLKFKIYVSALTSLSMDNTSRINTTDNRFLRRMVRDASYRNRVALDTLKGWGGVRRGEEEYVFPYQEQADTMFNSALFFEMSILKKYAEPLLMSVPDTVPEYGEASRLLGLLNNFVPIDDSEIPPTSILREFIGGSSFRY